MGMPHAKKCTLCSPAVYFGKIFDYNNHLKTQHDRECQLYIGDTFKCTSCRSDTYFDTCVELQEHIAAGIHN